MMARLSNIYRLGVKELRSVRSDPVMVFLLVWAFTFMIYQVAENAKMEVSNASIAILDEDHSELSRRIRDAFLQPAAIRGGYPLGPAAGSSGKC
jgi:ABC-2 type transport system permease protein